MRLRYLTVPHTGTNWGERLLAAYGVQIVHEHIRPGRALATDASLPTLVMVRHPLLHVISKLNQGDEPELVSYRVLARLLADGAHGFQLDVSAARRNAEIQRVESFLRSTGHPVPDDVFVDWSPVAGYEDVTGLKARFLGGESPHELLPFIRDLLGWPEVVTMMAEHRYTVWGYA